MTDTNKTSPTPECVLIPMARTFVAHKPIDHPLPINTTLMLNDIVGSPKIGRVFDVTHYLIPNVTVCRFYMEEGPTEGELRVMLEEAGFIFDKRYPSEETEGDKK